MKKTIGLLLMMILLNSTLAVYGLGDSLFEAKGLNKKFIISTSMGHTVALAENGVLWAWGSNYQGQFGYSDKDSYNKPMQIENMPGVVKISAGGKQTVALKKDGTVWACGNNSYGQLGTGSNTPNISSEWVRWGNELQDFIDVVAGENHTVAIRSDSTVWACGDNFCGQLGTGSNLLNVETPKQVSGLTDVSAIAAGKNHTIALKKDGTVWAWGNYRGAPKVIPKDVITGPEYKTGAEYSGVGRDVFVRPEKREQQEFFQNTPIQVEGLTGVTSIQAGEDYSVILKSDGTVWAFGINEHGQLGTGMYSREVRPVQVEGLTGIVAIAAGNRHTVVLREDGTVWIWGSYGVVGPVKGTISDETRPVQVPNLDSVIAISAGGDIGSPHTMAVKKDGSVWAWGSNQYGMLGNGSFTDSLTPVQVHGTKLFEPINELESISNLLQIPDSKQITVEGASEWAITGVKAIKGYHLAEDDLYKDLGKPIERQEFAVLAVKLYQKATGNKLKAPTNFYFSDINECKYKNYVQQAYELKIVNGSEGKFRPKDTITRQEVCILLQNLLKSIDPNGTYEVKDDIKFVDDSEIASWARNSVIYAYKNKIMSGTGELRISPLGTTTVEQAMVLTYNLGVAKNYISQLK